MNASLLPVPKIIPVLDLQFRPAVLANRAHRAAARSTGRPVPVRLALEQSDGSVFHSATEIFPENHPQARANFDHLERFVKFLLWARGGWRVHFAGPQSLAASLQKHLHETATGRFDSEMIGRKIFDRAIEIVHVADNALPPELVRTQPLGRQLDGCRIGFDLGGSDRKVAAVIDGEVVFSDETVWDPYFQADPQYHFDGVMDSLKKAAAARLAVT